MFASLSDIIKIPVAIVVGIVIATIVLLFYYEGVSLPFFGQVISGRVANAAEAAKEGYVRIAEKAAADAKADELQRQLDAANTANQSLQDQINQNAVQNAQREKDRENDITGYELRLSAANRRCALNADDIDTIMRVH